MSYVFFKENIIDIPSRDFYNLNFSKEFIDNIKNRLNEYVNKDNIFELSKSISNIECVSFEIKDRLETEDKNTILSNIKEVINDITRCRFLFTYYIDLNYENSYKNIIYIFENTFEEIKRILDENKDFGIYKVTDKLSCMFENLKKLIDDACTHLSYVTGSNETIGNKDIDIVKRMDDLLCPFVSVSSTYYKHIPFSVENPENEIYEILFDTVSILKEVLNLNSQLDLSDISKKILIVEDLKENKDFKNIAYFTFALYDIIVNSIVEYIEDIQCTTYSVYSEYGEFDDCGILKDECVPNKLLCKIKFIKEFKEQRISREAIGIDDASKEKNISLNDIDGDYKSKWLKMQKTLNEIFKIKIGKLKLKAGATFFKRWYGRIPSMYSRYGSEATLPENNMKDDPVTILTSSGVQYLNRLSTDAETLFNNVLETCKKITSAGNLVAKLNCVKEYCKQYPIEEGINSDPKTIITQIKNETYYRIAKAIMQDNDVYGYSINGIVENGKFPTCNHIVVSLFIDNPHEKPQSISVSSIFSNPESLLIFAKPEKLYIVESTYRKSMSKILNNFNYKTTSTVIKNMDANYKMFTSNLVKQSNKGMGMVPGEETGGEDIKQAKKIAKAIEKGMVDAVNSVIEQKRRCIQCVGIMYDMMNRIQQLAKRCIAAMHEIEVNKSDKNFKSGINSNGLNMSTVNARNQIKNGRIEEERNNN